MSVNTKKKGVFLLLAVLMLLLFNAPIISIANKVAFVCDIPVLYLYLFSVWFVCIILLLLISSFRNTDRNKYKRQNEPSEFRKPKVTIFGVIKKPLKVVLSGFLID